MSICVNKANYTHDMIMRTGLFNVSILSQQVKFDLFKRFGFQSGKDVNKFADFNLCKRGENGLLYVTDGTNAYISVKVDKVEDLGSHTMFIIGEVTDMEVLSDYPSVTYEYYMNNIKPKPQEVRKDRRWTNDMALYHLRAMSMLARSFRRISFVLCVSIRHQILKK